MADVPLRHQQLARSNPNTLDNIPKAFRVGGSGFTAFHWMNHVIGFAQTISHTSPQPVAQPVAIQPLDQARPIQIIVPAAIGAGTLQVQLFELYNRKIWDQIMRITDDKSVGLGTAGSLTQYNDLAEIFLRLAAVEKPISCTKIVYPPNTGVFPGAQKIRAYADTYHGCVITDVRDDEQIDIGTMEVIKNLTIQYTKMVRHVQNA